MNGTVEAHGDVHISPDVGYPQAPSSASFDGAVTSNRQQLLMDGTLQDGAAIPNLPLFSIPPAQNSPLTLNSSTETISHQPLWEGESMVVDHTIGFGTSYSLDLDLDTESFHQLGFPSIDGFGG